MMLATNRPVPRAEEHLAVTRLVAKGYVLRRIVVWNEQPDLAPERDNTVQIPVGVGADGGHE